MNLGIRMPEDKAVRKADEMKLLRAAHRNLVRQISRARVDLREMEELINDGRGATFGRCRHCGAPTLNGKWGVTL